MPPIIEITKRQLTLSTHRIHTMPIVVLMPHSSCNCRCVMCDIWMANQNKQQLTRADLASHMDHLNKLNVRWVVLSGGEPLMHGNLWTLCQLLKESGVKITILSTGLLLKRFSNEIVRWCDEVIVSLDGSQEVHDRIRRVPQAYERLAKGVAALRAVDPQYRVTARTTLQRMNYFDMPNIIQAAQELGLDQISFLAADVSTTAFNRPMTWGEERVSEVALSSEEVKEFEQVMEEVIDYYRADIEAEFIVESESKLRALVQYFAAIADQSNFPKIRCNAPWVSTVIEADGTVRPCFFHRPIGNIREQPLLQILNSEDALQFRRNLDVNRDPICEKCVCTLYLGPKAEI